MARYVNGILVEDDENEEEIEDLEENQDEPEGIYISDDYFDESQFSSVKIKSIYRGFEPSTYDVVQRQDNACFLLANLKALAQTNPDIIKKLIKVNDNNSVTVNLFAVDGNEKKPLPITIDKTVVNLDSDSAPWVRLVEKAVAASGLANSKYLGKVPNAMIDENGEFIGSNIVVSDELNGGDPGLFMNLIVPGKILDISETKQNEMIAAADVNTARKLFKDTLSEAFANNYPVTVNLSDGELNHVAVLSAIEEHDNVQCLRIDDQLNGRKFVPLIDAFNGESEIINISIYPINKDGSGDIAPQYINTAMLYKRFKEAQRLKNIQNAEPKKPEAEELKPEKIEPEKIEPEKIEPEKIEPEKIEPENKEEIVNDIQVNIKIDEADDADIAPEKGVIKDEQIDLFRRGIGKMAKELENAKTFTNSDEYKYLITMMKSVASGEGKEAMRGDTEAATFANQVYYIKNRIDAYLDHKAKDGVKPNVYRKLLAVEKTSKLLKKCAEALGEQKIERRITGENAPGMVSNLKFSYKDEILSYENLNGVGTAPLPKSKEKIEEAANRITAPGKDNSENIRNIRAVDNCMCKIMLRAQVKHYATVGELARLRENFIENPPFAEKTSPEKNIAQNNLNM